MNRTTRKTRKKPRTTNNSLRTSYGIVILPKGTKLYHASVNNRCILPAKPVIFTTLHPSEWYTEDSYISVIELQREVTLLFMIRNIRRMRIFSVLNSFLGVENSNLEKMNYTKISGWLPYLRNENLDGWFCSIENKGTVEFAIINDPSILKITECKLIKRDWVNVNYTENMNLIPKRWGTQYPISSTVLPMRFVLNRQFQAQIEAYKKEIAEDDPRGTAFSVILENAIIDYIDAPVNTIRWITPTTPVPVGAYTV